MPLVTKGRGEAESPANLNMNYFLGIDGSTGVLTADFEDTATGGNHPVAGVTPLADHAWYHAAATYDGTTWRLYLNGTLDRELAVGAYTPEASSIQHAGLATAMTSTGVASGYFNGVLDEVRIWNVARSGAEIAANANTQITGAQTGLVGRWALDEGTGTTVAGSAGTTVNGTITGANWGWWAAAPFDAAPPAPPAAPSGLGATALSAMVVRVAWTDNADDETGFELERSTTGSGAPENAPVASAKAYVTPKSASSPVRMLGHRVAGKMPSMRVLAGPTPDMVWFAQSGTMSNSGKSTLAGAPARSALTVRLTALGTGSPPPSRSTIS